MTLNRTVNLIIRFLGKPVLVGLCAAALLLLVFPEIRQQDNSVEQSSIDLDNRSQANEWAGPVSYSNAVKRAAPSVYKFN